MREDMSPIQRIHSPIGLCRAESPAEIAVSIAAQLIEVRAGKK
jgi:xanthine/CO dehydrogenase XdhC/CoxF family maturation factor